MTATYCFALGHVGDGSAVAALTHVMAHSFLPLVASYATKLPSASGTNSTFPAGGQQAAMGRAVYVISYLTLPVMGSRATAYDLTAGYRPGRAS